MTEFVDSVLQLYETVGRILMPFATVLGALRMLTSMQEKLRDSSPLIKSVVQGGLGLLLLYSIFYAFMTAAHMI